MTTVLAVKYKRRDGPLTSEWLKAQTIEDSNGCWIWQRYTNIDGYGQVGSENTIWGAHRLMYALTFEKKFNPILHVLHECDVPPCINPKHLYQGTQQDNVRDRVMRGHQSYTKGEDAGRAKLTERQVKAIRKDLRSLTAITVDYPVSRSQVARIKRQEQWIHI